MLKIVAAMLGVSYGDLVRRDQARSRARHAIGWSFALFVILMFALSVDAGFDPPGSTAIRRFLDECEISAFRSNPTITDIDVLATNIRSELCAALSRSQEPNGWFEAPIDRSPKGDPWTTAQCLCALLKAPEATPAQLGRAVDALESLFASDCKQRGLLVERGERHYGWMEGWNPTTLAEVSLWAGTAVSVALTRAGLLDSLHRERFVEYFRYVQSVLDNYLGDETLGAWNPFPNQEDVGAHSNHTTALALMYLIESRETGLGWHASESRLVALLRATATRLIQDHRFDEQDPDASGWSAIDKPNRPIVACLTVQIYALLLRAQRSTGIILPAQLTLGIERRALLLSTRPALAEDAGDYDQAFTDHDGHFRGLGKKDSITFYSFPWLTSCSREILCPGNTEWRREPTIRFRRLLALRLERHVREVVDVAQQKPWQGAEILYVLSCFPRE